MKTLIQICIVIAFFFIGNLAYGQGVAVNEDNSTADPSSIMDVKSITKGMLIPRMSTAERTAIASPAEGLFVYDNSTSSFWYHDGSTWVEQTSEPNDDVNDADADPNNEIQVLSVSGNVVSLSNGGGSVTVNVTDADSDPANEIQVLSSTTSGTNRTIILSNGGGSTTISVADNDNNSSNELQTLSKSGSTVTLSNGGGSITDDVNDADSNPNNEIQNLSSSTSGTNRTINISGGAGTTISVADNDNSTSNELQNLSISGSTLSLSGGGGSVSIPSSADNLGNHSATTTLDMNANFIDDLGTGGINFRNDLFGGGGDDASIQYISQGGENTLLRFSVGNDSDDNMSFEATGGIDFVDDVRMSAALRINNFAGGGTRMVTTDNSGNIGVQAIPSGADNLGNHTATTTLNLNNNWLYVKPSVSSNVGNIGVGWNGNSTAYAIYQESGAWTNPYPDMMIRFHTGLKLSAEHAYGGIKLYAGSGEAHTASFNASGMQLHQGTHRIDGLAGGGTRMIVTDNSGNLSAQAIPSGGDNLGNHNATTTLQMNNWDVNSAKEVYVNNWVRHNDNDGTYWSNNQWHIYPRNADDMNIRTGNGGSGGMALMNGGSTRGYLHWTADNHGWLNSARQWQLRTRNDDGLSPNIYWDEEGNESWTGNPGADEGKIEYHSNRFYIASGSNSTEIVRFRRSGSDVGIVNNGGEAYFPIYRDWNDAGYYLDPNSTSDAALRIRGGALHGPNPTWGSYLMVGGNGRQNYTNNGNVASVATTNGNLHMDAASGRDMYLNHYDGNTIRFGRGNNSDRALLDGNGLYLYDGWYRTHNQTGWYNQTYGGGWYMVSSGAVRVYNNKDVEGVAFAVGPYNQWPAFNNDGQFYRVGGQAEIRVDDWLHFRDNGGAVRLRLNTDNGYYYGNFTGNSSREIKKDITMLDDGISARIMSDIESLTPALYRYKHESTELVEGEEGQYRANLHLGVILEDAPDYLQDNMFQGIDLYSLSALALAGVKHNRESIKSLVNKVSGQSATANQKVNVRFSEEFKSAVSASGLPLVHITPTSMNSGYFVSEVTENGFTVEANQDFSFNWMAELNTSAIEEAQPRTIAGMDIPAEEKERYKAILQEIKDRDAAAEGRIDYDASLHPEGPSGDAEPAAVQYEEPESEVDHQVDVTTEDHPIEDESSPYLESPVQESESTDSPE